MTNDRSQMTDDEIQNSRKTCRAAGLAKAEEHKERKEKRRLLSPISFLALTTDY
jgi:hypothetical protein